MSKDYLPNSSYCSDTGLCNNHDLDIGLILHKWDLFIVEHYHNGGFKNETIIFFCKSFLNASAEGTCIMPKQPLLTTHHNSYITVTLCD